MKFRGAVLETVGAPTPWTDTTPINVAELTLDAPGRGELLVRMEAAGVCHSDLSRVSGVRVCAVPMVLGHEGSGIIEELGEDCGDLKVGQRVTMTFMPRCGECAACTSTGWALCLNGTKANAEGTLLHGDRRLHLDGRSLDHHGGVSAFAEYAVVDKHSVVPLPEGVPADVGALLGCAVLTGGGAVINAAKIQPGESVAIIGMGGVGLAAALVAKAVGASAVTAIDMLPAKLETSLEIGATAAYTPAEAEEAGLKFDAVIECVGNPRALSNAINLTKPGGRTVTVGLPRPDARLEISPLSLVLEARQLIGSYMGSGVPSEDIAMYAQMYLDGVLPVEKLISGTIALEDINHAMDELREGKVIRQIVDFRGSAS
ncbi:alcohol dehydrogenase catalytic domain-containing protein [Arthrobacter sedimenti]|uniref:alcohol dehydrogenase catalytic domain-containing protein n=1 Tax=Arthrobacter sedimenti TaxID=2694931 RepID=UPI000B356293|nr:zinc-binding dehydrogenase [Arthrobacter sedimenti]OUM45093.1 alcohol dehydrogenase [Arthrobacter agilis]